MQAKMHRDCSRTGFCLLLLLMSVLPAFAQTTDISATPSSLSFANTYVGKASGSQVVTINYLLTKGNVIIESIAFDCAGYGIASGVAPFTLNTGQTLTHYSIFFQPTAVQTYNCNFILSLGDGTSLMVPLSGTGSETTAAPSVSISSMTFPNQVVGTTSAPQTVTITNNGGSVSTLNSVTLSPPSFTVSTFALPYAISPKASLTFSVYYTPSEITSQTGALDLTYKETPDNGVSLTGNGIAASALTISSSPTLPQATQNAAYQATLATTGGVGPYSWALSPTSTLPAGLTLSSAGVISGTLASSVAAGSYQFTVQVTDQSNGATANTTFVLSVYANLGDNCNDISYNDPNTGTPLVAITDLGTGLFEGYEGGLYPNGSNVRPSAQDSYGVGLAYGIQPLDSNGNPSPTGKYVLLAVGESTLQNEFNRLLPIADADPSKNPNLVIVNGAQGGATPANFASASSAYWLTTLNNYLPQNGVTANQVVAAIVEDTDGIATGTFPSDVTTLQSQYESMMETMLTLFPNLKLVYFSSRVYAGYSNGVGSPDNPEPYAYEVGYAVKWAIQDQLNGNSNLNYNPQLGPVVAPWMSWGPYYWSNGMLGRADGFVWDCADFSPDGTHPSSTFGQLKVATALLNFFKTDDTTIPWYLAPQLSLAATAGNNQSGTAGTTLPTALTVLASNLNGGAPEPGVSVTFSDNGAGGTFGTPVATSNSSGNATTTYTLPATAQTVTISASSSGYPSASFTETATAPVLALTATSGNNQSGGAGTTLPASLTVLATSNGNPVAGVSVSFSDGGVGGTFGSPIAITGSNGMASATYTLPATAQTVTITSSSTGYSSAIFVETATLQVLAASAGNNQSGVAGSTLATALSVLATSNGTPVPGVSVTFSDGGVGGSFGSPTAVTGSSGTASSTYTLPATAQTVTISATSPAFTSASFTETGTAPLVLALTPTAGDNQTGGTGTTLPTALTVTATSNGTPVQGVSIAFSDGGVGGSFGTPTAVTGSNGTASSTYTLPATAQTVSISATSSGFTSASFTETADVQALSVSAGNNQTGGLGSTLPVALTVVAMANGSPAAGVSVIFSDGGAGGSFGTPTAVTGSNGMASSTYTLPATAQTVTVTASSSGYTSTSFTETSAVCALTATSGSSQSGMAGTLLPTSLSVTASCSGAPESGVSVTFSDGGAGGSFGTPVASTNGSGVATTTYTLPATVETVTITAASPGYSSASFTETSTPVISSLSLVSGGRQTGAVGTTLPLPLLGKSGVRRSDYFLGRGHRRHLLSQPGHHRVERTGQYYVYASHRGEILHRDRGRRQRQRGNLRENGGRPANQLHHSLRQQPDSEPQDQAAKEPGGVAQG